MKQMVCSVCTYTYDEARGIPEAGIAPGTKWEDLPDDWRCPWCGAGKEMFREKEAEPAPAGPDKALAEFFRAEADPAPEASTEKLLEQLEWDLSAGYPYANGTALERADRGALRALVWSEKVTRMLQSLLRRYQSEGERMLAHSGVYVCSVCGFVYVGDAPPELCPVCKVPGWKFERAERRI